MNGTSPSKDEPGTNRDELAATGAACIQLLSMLLDQHADLPTAVDAAYIATLPVTARA